MSFLFLFFFLPSSRLGKCLPRLPLSRSRRSGLFLSLSLSFPINSRRAFPAFQRLDAADSNSRACRKHFKNILTPQASRSARMSSRSATSGTRRSGENGAAAAAEEEEIGADASISEATTFSSAATARGRGEVGRSWPRETAAGASVRPLRAAERRWSGLPASTGAARVACCFFVFRRRSFFFQRKRGAREEGKSVV